MNQQETASPKRGIQWIETGRTFAMIVVVLVHTLEFNRPHGVDKAFWEIMYSALARFSVPFFFIVSGMLLQKSLQKSKTRPALGPFFRKKLSVLIVPFLAWNVIYMLVLHLTMKMPIESMGTVWNLFTGYIHLYYVFVLIQFFLYPLIYPYISKKGPEFVFAISIGASFAFYCVSEMLLWSQGPDHHFFEWYLGKCFVGWSIFFFWGTYLAAHPEIFEKLKARWGRLFAVALVSYAAYLLEMELQVRIQGEISRDYFLISGLVFQFTFATLFMIWLEKLNNALSDNRLLRGFNNAGQDTFGIYLGHLAIISLSVYVVTQASWDIPRYIRVPVILLVAWFACVAAVRICRHPKLRLLNRLLFGGR